MTAVVDASVVLAWLQDEPGAEEAEPLLMEGVSGAANWSEVLRKTRRHGAPPEVVGRLLASLGLTVANVTAADAEIGADLWRHETALSLADRLCLGLAIRMDLEVATADAAWADVEGGPDVVLVR